MKVKAKLVEQLVFEDKSWQVVQRRLTLLQLRSSGASLKLTLQQLRRRLKAVIGEIFGHNRLTSECLQVQPVTRC